MKARESLTFPRDGRTRQCLESASVRNWTDLGWRRGFAEPAAAGRPRSPAHSAERARVRPTASPTLKMATANRAHTPQSASSGSTVSADTKAMSEAPVIALLAQYVGVKYQFIFSALKTSA